MPKERVFLVDVDVVSRKGKTALRLFLKREKDGKAFAAYDYDFKPYFYLLPDEKTVGEKGSKKREQFVDSVTASSFEFNKHLARVLKVEGVERFLNAEKIEVLKVVCSHPFVVPHVRERLKQFGQTFEYAIAFHFRYVIDKKIVPNSLVELEYEGSLKSAQVKSVKAVDSDKRPAYRVVAFDIETFNSGAAMHPEKDPCIMISACSPKECRVFTYSKKIPLKFVDVRKGEGEMIDAFCDFVRENRADFLCSYNGDAFDLPYLKTRAKKTRAVFRLGRDKSQVSVKKFGAMSKSKVGGRVHFDVYRAVSFLNIVGSVKLQRLTLKSVYAEILGGKKLDFSHEDVWRAWESGKNLEELAQYSKVDAQACFDLAKYALPNAIEMSRVSGMPVFDSSHASTGQLVEFLLMRESFDSNQLVPPKPQYAKVSARTANPIKGAFVKMPEPGIYENIAVMDFKSLYPSIIVSYNIDPSTLDCECCKTGFESPLGQRFCSKRKGLIPHALEKILDARNIAKKEMKKFDSKSEDYRILDARQWSLKVLANSVGPGEPVILLDPSNMLRIVPIGEFVDSAASFRLVEKSEVGFKKGWKAACFIGNRIQFKPVQAVIRHKCSGNVFKIQLKSGRSVVVTKDHSLFTLNDKGCVAPVKGLEVKKGSFLIVPKKFPALNEKTTLEFSIMHSLAAAPVEELRDIIVTAKLPHPKDVLANFEKILDCLKKPLFIGLICKRTGLSRSAVSKLLRKMEKEGFVRIVRVRNRCNCSLTLLGRQYAHFISSILSKMKYNGNKREHFVFFNKIRECVLDFKPVFFKGFKIGTLNGFRRANSLKLNSKIASFLGFYVSEGYSRKWLNRSGGYSYRVGLTSFNVKILKKMFASAKNLDLPLTRTTQRIEINNKLAFLISKFVFEAGCNAAEKQVPPAIFSCSDVLRRNFLQAYFQGDGNFEKHAKRTRFTTVSKKLAMSLTVLLNQLDFGAVSIKKDGKFFRIVVNEDVFVNTSRERFGAFSFTLPGRLLAEEIRKSKITRYYSSMGANISLSHLKKFYSEYRSKIGKSEKIERLLNFLRGSLALDEVVGVEPVKESCGYVYDLSVKDAENFVGGFGCMCLHNSFYGYLAYPRSRWYSRLCGEATTAFGRHYIKDTMEKAEKEGFKVLYGDSDSVFLQYEKGKDKDVLDFRKKINKELPGRMELELEDLYPRGIFVGKKISGKKEEGAKKKYALINREGKVKIRGFELVRRDWSNIARDTQREVLQALLKDGSVEKAVLTVRGAMQSLQEGKVALEDVAIMTQLQKKTSTYEIVSPEVSAVLKARQAGKKIPEGALVQYVVTSKGKTISDKAQVLELAEDYDSEYYVNNQVLPAVLKLLGAFGVSADSLKTGKKQSTLDSW